MSRKGPTLSATLFEPGKKCTGSDGNLWIVFQTKNGTNRWKIHKKGKHKVVKCKAPYAKPKKSTAKSKKSYWFMSTNKYATQDNGGFPFLVVRKPNSKIVSIFAQTNKFKALPWEASEKVWNNIDDKRKLYTKLLKKYTNVSKFFVGRDYSGYAQHGNSILLKLPKKRYAYIGEMFYEFNAPEDITHYYSWMGNSSVPYPVALSKNFAFFMLDRVYINRSEFQKGIVWADAYGAFYGHRYWNEPKKQTASQKKRDPNNIKGRDANAKNLKHIKMKKIKVIAKRMW